MNASGMNAFELTRALIDIDSVTPNEEQVGVYLAEYLGAIAARTGGHVERIEVEPHRYNVLAYWDAPVVTFSTHIDTVPPFFASREDDEFIWGRGACDTKGIIASMIFAVEALLAAGERRVALLFVVGEERNSAGAFAAARDARGSKFLINGEPTESKLVLGSKGALRFEVVAQGRMAHSAYPHLGESAIEKLLDVLNDLRNIEWPDDGVFGETTCNIGILSGGVRANVIPSEAQATLHIRLAKESSAVKELLEQSIDGRAIIDYKSVHDPVRLFTTGGFDQMLARFTTDIPYLSNWGRALLIGPGSILDAHTDGEKIRKSDLTKAVELYVELVKAL